MVRAWGVQSPPPMTTTYANTHPGRTPLADSSLRDAHAPVHQSRLPRLVFGAIALVPAVSLGAALGAEGAEQVALGFFNVLWTGLLMLMFGGWMVTSRRFSSGQRLGWIFAFVLAAPLSLPLYWYRHVWQAPEAQVVHD